MSYFKAEMHQIRFRLAGGAYSAPPDPLAGLRGPTSTEWEGRGRKASKLTGSTDIYETMTYVYHQHSNDELTAFDHGKLAGSVPRWFQ